MGNILCCIKPRDDDLYNNDKNKLSKKNTDGSEETAGKETDNTLRQSFKNKNKKFPPEMPNKNFINADFETFNERQIEQPKKNNDKKLQNINEEEDDIDYEKEMDIYDKVKIETSKRPNDNIKSKPTNKYSKNVEKTNERDNEMKNPSPKKKIDKNEILKQDNEEIQYAIDDENLKSQFSKKKINQLNGSDYSDELNTESEKKNNRPEILSKLSSDKSAAKTDNKISNNMSLDKNTNKPSQSILNVYNPKINYRLEIFIESFYLNTFDNDNFGPHFLPYLEISLNNEQPEKVNLTKDLDNSKLNNSNNSNISDLDVSMNMNNSYIKNTLNNTSKNYLMRYLKNYVINSKQIYENDTNLIFSLKNGLIFKKTDNKNNSNIPIITIGSESINLGKLNKLYKDNIFEGCLEIKFRKNSPVGKLNVFILLTEEKGDIKNIDLEEQTPMFEEFIRSKNYDDFDDDQSQKSANKISILWKNNYIDSDELTNDVIIDFFVEDKNNTNVQNKFIKFKVKEEENNQTDSINTTGILINEENNQKISEENLRDLFFFDCLQKKNKFALFNLYHILINFLQYGHYDILDKFVSLLDEPQVQFFVELHKFDDKNLFLYKSYFMIINSYIVYHKNNNNEYIRNNYMINQDILIRNVFFLLQNLKSFEKKYESIMKKYLYHYKECIILALNTIWDLCYEPEDLVNDKSSKKSKQDFKDQKKKDLTNVYKNCLLTNTYRNLIVYFLNNFSDDSEISGMIYRLLRKAFQILTRESIIGIIDKKVLSEEPEKIFDQLIQGIIFTDNNNFFINATKLAMGKFNHYPELQNNILLILFSLLNKSDMKAIKKFVEIFDITHLNSHLNIYRCKIRGHAKDINFYHLNILYILSYNFNKLPPAENSEYLISIAYSISNFYDKSNKRYNDFTNRKYVEIQIQEMILKIVNLLSKNKECCLILFSCDFFNDLIIYLNNFCSRKSDMRSENADRKSISSMKTKDYILYIAEKKKRRMNLDSIKKSCSNIILNVLNIVFNVTNNDDQIFDKFTIILAGFGIEDSDSLADLLEDSIKVLEKHQVKSEDMLVILDKIKNSFGDEEGGD